MSSYPLTTYSIGSRVNFQHQLPTYSQQRPIYSHAQQSDLYDEQPYYSIEPSVSRESYGGDDRRIERVCIPLFFSFRF